tara:strand:- start:215 stop:865 length:651 start_codon:yes stop_codon:yes gene_type:complete
MDSFTTNPAWGPSKATLLSWGALNADKVMHCAELWRLFTSLWLNAGLIQLGMNLFGILRIGLFVEYRWRWMRYAAIYFLCGVAGGLLSLILQPASVSVCSSNALCGIVAAYTVEVMFTWYKTERFQRVVTLLICVMFLSGSVFFAIIDPYIDNSAMFGSGVIGILLGCYYSLIESDFNLYIKTHVPNTILVIVTCYFVVGVTVFYVLVPVPTKNQC